MCLPAKLAASLGNIGPLVLVTRVTNAITLTDPLTLRQGAFGRGGCAAGLVVWCRGTEGSEAGAAGGQRQPTTAQRAWHLLCVPSCFPAHPDPPHPPVCILLLPAAVLEAAAYWRTPLKPMMGSRQLTEFYVLDAEAAVPQGEAAVRCWFLLGWPVRCPGGVACGRLRCMPRWVPQSDCPTQHLA